MTENNYNELSGAWEISSSYFFDTAKRMRTSLNELHGSDKIKLNSLRKIYEDLHSKTSSFEKLTQFLSWGESNA